MRSGSLFKPKGKKPFRGAGITAQWCQRSPPANLSRGQFLGTVSYVG